LNQNLLETFSPLKDAEEQVLDVSGEAFENAPSVE
jgi:hypothetical protein